MYETKLLQKLDCLFVCKSWKREQCTHSFWASVLLFLRYMKMFELVLLILRFAERFFLACCLWVLLAGVLKNRRIANFSVEFAICSASGFCSIQRTIGKWANENKKWNHFLWKIILLRTINGMGGMCGCGCDWIKFT